MDLVWASLTIAVLGGMIYAAYRIEPHWVAKSGDRFIGNGQPMNDLHMPVGRWREVRVALLADGALRVDQRRKIGMGKLGATIWTVVSRMPEATRPALIEYLLRGRTSTGAPTFMMIRIPKKSPMVAVLDSIATQ